MLKRELIKEQIFFLRSTEGIDCKELDKLILFKKKYKRDIQINEPLNEKDIFI